MDRSWFAAAGGTAVLHGTVIATALAFAGPSSVRDLVRPVEVALIRAPEPEPQRQVEAPRPPEPLPVRAPPPRTRRAPAPQPVAAPLPPQPVAVAKPVDAPRPSAITAAPAPPEAPAAPAVSAGVPAAAPAQVAAAPAKRVGPRLDASWSGNAPPPYPAMARRMGEEGEVRLDIHVGPDGQVLEVRVKRSSGSQLLDQTASETVKRWRFTPATVDGTPVAEWYYNWKWIFRLES